jgi:hypothetical protein
VKMKTLPAVGLRHLDETSFAKPLFAAMNAFGIYFGMFAVANGTFSKNLDLRVNAVQLGTNELVGHLGFSIGSYNHLPILVIAVGGHYGGGGGGW